MEEYLKNLQQELLRNPIRFNEDSDLPCLEALWWVYGETHSMSTSKTMELFRTIREGLLAAISIEETIGQISCLCAEHERIAFMSGLRLGVQLWTEIFEKHQECV